jgi:hypothetical protein
VRLPARGKGCLEFTKSLATAFGNFIAAGSSVFIFPTLRTSNFKASKFEASHALTSITRPVFILLRGNGPMKQTSTIAQRAPDTLLH